MHRGPSHLSRLRSICAVTGCDHRHCGLGMGLQVQSTCLVGVMTRAKMPYGSSESRCRMGRANAAVFPLPVFAQPMQSLPIQ